MTTAHPPSVALLPMGPQGERAVAGALPSVGSLDVRVVRASQAVALAEAVVDGSLVIVLGADSPMSASPEGDEALIVAVREADAKGRGGDSGRADATISWPRGGVRDADLAVLAADLARLAAEQGLVGFHPGDMRDALRRCPRAVAGTGVARGAAAAARAALASPLLAGADLRECQAVLVHVIGDARLPLADAADAVQAVADAVAEGAEIHYNVFIDAAMGGSVRVTLFAARA